MHCYGFGECVQCGQPSERHLPVRFPHLCDDCLGFSGRRDTEAVVGGYKPAPTDWTLMLVQLHRAVRQQRPPYRPEIRDEGEL